jgi:DNA-binding response OmpR family regulator
VASPAGWWDNGAVEPDPHRAQTVLVVDDEIEIVEILRDYLEADGFRVIPATDGTEALVAVHGERVDCVVLDLMMPGASGFEVCRSIRAESDAAVLFLSARDADADKIRGLGLGDDYIVKTASPGEIVARVKAVLPRARPRPHVPDTGEGLLDLGRIVLDVRAHEVRVDGRPVALTAREFALLQLLAEHPRQVFSREHLFERLWGTYGDRSTVWAYVRRLREKIEADPAQPRHIVTIRGAGYRFEVTAS